MKIQDAISQNKAYWEQQIKTLTNRLSTHQQEVQNIALQLNEAQEQIVLYDKAAQILVTLDQKQVDAVDVEVKLGDAEAKPVR